MFDHLSSNISTAPNPFLNVGPSILYEMSNRMTVNIFFKIQYNLYNCSHKKTSFFLEEIFYKKNSVLRIIL